MSPDIRELDAETRDRIAAGEVVERPASVVKELVENALDADASRVAVQVESGGKERIVVSDDGVGMSEAEAKKAVREHTTSKLRTVDDLEAIGTLGFRGEALHAIGSVARLSIRTKPRGGSRGTELVVEGGEVRECGPVGCPEGTTVEVTRLFGNVPARRKYLKTDTTEFAHVQRVVSGYALAAPGVAVSLERDGREAFATAGDGDRRSAVMAVYGREVAASMIPVGDARDDTPEGEGEGEEEVDGDADDAGGSLLGIEGFVSHPETNRAGREYVTTLVNGRYVTASVVREAVVEAYGSQLAPDRYPFAVVDVDLPPGGVDVNVHPRKLEVLFAEETGVRKGVREAVEAALLEEGLLRSRAPRGRSAPDQTELPGERSDSAAEGSSGSGSTAGALSDPDPATGTPTNPDPGAEASQAPDRTEGGDTAPRRGGSGPDRTADHDGSRAVNTPGADADASNGNTDAPGTDAPAEGTDAPGAGNAPKASDAPAVDDADRSSTPTDPAVGGRSGHEDGDGSGDAPDPGRKFRESPAQRTLDGAETTGTPAELRRLPSMEVLGQFDDTYLVAETADGLVLIDQHAADERVNFERLREAFAGDVTTQALAEPVELELTAREAAVLEDRGEALSRLGFRVQRPDERTAAVTTVPALVAERAGSEAAELARDLLSAFVDGDPEGTVEAVVDDLLGDLACHPSITGNTALREGSVAELLAALDDCENPYACPHGRPTVVELSREEIADRFERDYPGHGGRRE